MLYVHTHFLLAQNIWKLVWKYWNVLLEITELLIITHRMLIYNFICGLISLLLTKWINLFQVILNLKSKFFFLREFCVTLLVDLVV